MSRIKQRMLQALYKPRKTRLFSADTSKAIKELDKAIEKSVSAFTGRKKGKGKKDDKEKDDEEKEDK